MVSLICRETRPLPIILLTSVRKAASLTNDILPLMSLHKHSHVYAKDTVRTCFVEVSGLPFTSMTAFWQRSIFFFINDINLKVRSTVTIGKSHINPIVSLSKNSLLCIIFHPKFSVTEKKSAQLMERKQRPLSRQAAWESGEHQAERQLVKASHQHLQLVRKPVSTAVF